MNDDTGFDIKPQQDHISKEVENLSRTYYNSSFPIENNNILRNSLFKYEHIRRRYVFDSIPFSMGVHSEYITTDTRNLKDIETIHPFKSISELKDAHYYSLNDLSYRHIRNMFNYNSTHTRNEALGLTAGQWQARKHSIKHETLIPMCEIIEGVPYIPLINYLVFWYSNPVLAMNTIHKKPNKTQLHSPSRRIDLL